MKKKKKKLKQELVVISLVTSIGFMENIWRTEVRICNYWQLFRNWTLKQMRHFKMYARGTMKMQKLCESYDTEDRTMTFQEPTSSVAHMHAVKD